MRALQSLAVAGLLVASAAPALAVDVVSARDPLGVLDALSQIGYPGGKLEKLDDGRTTISIQISGSPTYIDFYDCDANLAGCDTLYLFYAMNLKDGTTLQKANEWNFREITGRVSLDGNGDPKLDYAISTYSGIPVAVFEQSIRLWDRKVGQVKDFFDF